MATSRWSWRLAGAAAVTLVAAITTWMWLRNEPSLRLGTLPVESFVPARPLFDDALYQSTVPPRWHAGQTWEVMYEALAGRRERRTVTDIARFRVLALNDEEALVELLHPPGKATDARQTRRFSLSPFYLWASEEDIRRNPEQRMPGPRVPPFSLVHWNFPLILEADRPSMLWQRPDSAACQQRVTTHEEGYVTFAYRCGRTRQEWIWRKGEPYWAYTELVAANHFRDHTRAWLMSVDGEPVGSGRGRPRPEPQPPRSPPAK